MRDPLHCFPRGDDLAPEFLCERQVGVFGPCHWTEVFPRRFGGNSGEDVPFGKGDGTVRECGVDDLEVSDCGVGCEVFDVSEGGGGDDGGCQATGVEGLGEAGEHEGI